jgi:hypothetical protein
MNVQQYLRLLHAKVLYADCAGERAYVPSLHYNRLVKLQAFVGEVSKLQREIEPTKIIQSNMKTAAALSKLKSNTDVIDYASAKTIVNLSNEFSKLVEDKGFEGKKFKFFNAIEQRFREIMEIRNKLLDKTDNVTQRRRLAPSEDILEELEERPNQLHVILGDPGFGKTIHLQQLAERYVQRQRETEVPTLPVYVKAKHLAHAITIHATSLRGINRDAEDIFDEEDNEETMWEFSTYESEKEWRAILATAVTETHFSGNEEFVPSFIKLLTKYKGKIVFFVDAFDEVQEEHMPRLVHFLSRITNEETNDVVLTNRNSHSSMFGKFWAKMPEQDSANDRISKYHIDFTPEELRYDMPEKLMAAWEVDGMAIEVRMEKRYEAFSKVLTHPLFVGFFALMMKENHIMDELDALGDGLAIKEYTTNHVVFLNNVVDLGIKKAISDRDLKIKPARMREIYEAIAYGYHAANGAEDNIDDMLKKLRKTTILDVTQSEIKAIKNGVGPLYSSDGKRMQWTHKGMWEIGASRFTFHLPSLITPALEKPELFLLSHLQQYASLNRKLTLFMGLFGMIDTYPSRSVVHKLWRTFIPNKPLFAKLEQSSNGAILATILEDLEQDDLHYAKYIARCLYDGAIKFPHVDYFLECPEDTMRLFPHTHLSFGKVVNAFNEHPYIVDFILEHGTDRDYFRIGDLLSKLPRDFGVRLLDELRQRRRLPNRFLSNGQFNPANIDFTRQRYSSDAYWLLLSNWQAMFSDVLEKFKEYFLAIGKRYPKILSNAPIKSDDEHNIAAFVHATLLSNGLLRERHGLQLPQELFDEASLVGVLREYHRYD